MKNRGYSSVSNGRLECEIREAYHEKNRGESNHKSLRGLFKRPRLWLKLAVYCLVTSIAKYRAQKRLRGGIAGWERDKTSRAIA